MVFSSSLARWWSLFAIICEVTITLVGGAEHLEIKLHSDGLKRKEG